MPATTKVKDALWRVSVLLQDVAPQFNRWPEMELVNWANDAQLAITKYLPAACSRVDALKLKPGTRQSIEAIAAADLKPGDGSTPPATTYGVQPLSWVCNMGSDGLSPGDAIPEPVDRRILDSQSPNWHSIAGAKVRNVVYDPSTPLYFWVKPAVPASPAAVWIQLGWIVKPSRIADGNPPGTEKYFVEGSDASLLSIDDVYLDDWVDYVTARAFMKNADFAGNDGKAAFYTQRFLGSLNLRIQALTGNNPNLTRLPFAPEPIGAAK
jgi:hypothetical protein